MTFEHPLAYLLGIEGVALLHAFVGERDRAFTEARLAEVRALLTDERLDLGPALGEFARVLRQGGHLVTSDVHHEGVLFGSIPRVSGGRIPAYRHRTSDYLDAALPLGFQVRACVEPRMPAGPVPPAATDPGPPELWPWSLAAMVPAAAQAASANRPVSMIWHLQLL